MTAPSGAVAVSIATPAGPVSGLLLQPSVTPAKAVYVLAHGAGAGMRHRFMEDIAARLAALGVATLRYQFPYMEAGRSRTDSPAVAADTVRAACEEAASWMPGVPLFAGGKSFGGRMTSTAASGGGLPLARGLVFLGFPLHPPDHPGLTRAEHLDAVPQPMLFLQGTRDEFARPELLQQVLARLGDRATVQLIPEGKHSFEVPKRTGRTDHDVMADLARTMTEWMAQHSGA